MWTGKPINENADARNAVFYGDKAIDRSPWYGHFCQDGPVVCKGPLTKGASFVHESYIASTFTGKIEDEVKVGTFDAIIPSIEGWARIYGYNTILVDPTDDPYAGGFQVI